MNEKKTIQLERTWKATLAEVWALWTTKEGLESWWGPDGFRIEVDELDVRPGGKLRCRMIAVGANEIEFMKRSGMGVEHAVTTTLTEVVHERRLAMENVMDFIPGVAPYLARQAVEFAETETGVKMTVLIEPLHSPDWTGRAVAGWTSQLGKLDRRFALAASQPGSS